MLVGEFSRVNFRRLGRGASGGMKIMDCVVRGVGRVCRKREGLGEYVLQRLSMKGQEVIQDC